MKSSNQKRFGFRFDLLIVVYGFAFLMLFAIWLAVWFQLSTEKKSIELDNVNKGQALVSTFAEHCVHVLRQADHAINLYQELYFESNGKLSLSEFLHESSELRQALSSDVDANIFVMDSKGVVLHSSLPLNTKLDVSQFDFFRQHASRASSHLAVSTRLLDAQKQTWVLQLSRRLQTKDGKFAGVVSAQIDPIFLVDQYHSAELGVQGRLIVKNSADGLAVERLGQRLIRGTELQVQEDQQGQIRLQWPTLDHSQYQFSLRTLAQYDIQVLVGLPRELGAEKYRSYRQLYFAYAAILSLIVIIGLALLTRQTMRLRQSMKAAKQAESILSSAAEGSLDAFYILRCDRNPQGEILDFVITNVNQRGARLLGMPASSLIGKKLCEVLPAFRSAGYFAQYVKVVQSGAALEEEYEIAIPQIKASWLHHQIVTIGDGVAITVRDITARKNAELETHNNRNFLRSLIDYLPVLVSVSKLEKAGAEIIVWNKTAENLLGYSASSVIGKTAQQVFQARQAEQMQQDARQIIEQDLIELRQEVTMLRKDGTPCYVQTISVPIKNESGQSEYILWIGEDISLRREHELQLRKNQAEMAAVNDASPLGLVGADQFGQCTYVNRTFEDIAGISRDEALGDGWMRAIFAADRPQILHAFTYLSESRQSYQGIFRFQHPDARIVWASVKIAAIWIDGRIEGYVGSVDDITQRREAELALRESEARLRTITNTMPAMVAYIDAQERYRFHNLAYQREIGIDMNNSEGKTVLEVVGPARYQVIVSYIRRALAGETVIYEDDVSQNGVFRVLECNYIPQFAQDGKTVLGFHVMRQDITAQKLEEQRLLQLAQLDVLTGLSNRAGFMQKLRDAMTQCRSQKTLLGLMYMDIDYFKSINDTYGHHTGDLLLTAFAQRLCHSMRASDCVARLGGDEFTLIMENLAKIEDAYAIAEKVVQVMRGEFVLEQHHLHISTSIGLAFFRGDDSSAEALINQADMMLYNAKRSGRDTWRAAPLVEERG